MTAKVAIFLSLLALSFSIFSFWWLNARQGKLLVIGPQYVFGRYSSGTLAIEIPLVLRNTGPRAIVLSGLRLRFPSSDREDLVWVGFSENPIKGDLEFKRPIVVKGFDAVEKILFFHRARVANPTGGCDAELIAIYSPKPNWQSLSKFKMPSSGDGWSDHFTGVDIVGGLQTGELIEGDA
jgi:hypothetical protein